LTIPECGRRHPSPSYGQSGDKDQVGYFT
jgi:hypothetical protein